MKTTFSKIHKIVFLDGLVTWSFNTNTGTICMTNYKLKDLNVNVGFIPDVIQLTKFLPLKIMISGSKKPVKISVNAR